MGHFYRVLQSEARACRRKPVNTEDCHQLNLGPGMYIADQDVFVLMCKSLKSLLTTGSRWAARFSCGHRSCNKRAACAFCVDRAASVLGGQWLSTHEACHACMMHVWHMQQLRAYGSEPRYTARTGGMHPTSSNALQQHHHQAYASTCLRPTHMQAWRAVDRAYVDKGFNGQTWFRVREQFLKSEKFESREQTYAAIRKLLATLDDPFTRLLEPARLDALRRGTSGACTQQQGVLAACACVLCNRTETHSVRGFLPLTCAPCLCSPPWCSALRSP